MKNHGMEFSIQTAAGTFSVKIPDGVKKDEAEYRIQKALEFYGTRVFKCKHCGNTGVALTSAARFCNQACKQGDHRRKVREAKMLQSAGMNAAQIAKNMNITLKAIENWLSKKK